MTNIIDDLYCGTELEFENLEADKMNLIIENFNLTRMEKWRFSLEDTVKRYCPSSGKILGGEFVSPKYAYGSESFDYDVAEVTNILKKYKVKITDKVSNHFHFSASYFEDSLEWSNLIEVWLAYEPIIYRYGFDKDLMGRKLIWNYARPLGINRKDYLKVIDKLQSSNILLKDAKYNLNHNEYNLFVKPKGLNFNGVIFDPRVKTGRDLKYKPRVPTIEFRNCDLSLDASIIIKRLQMYACLLQSVKEKKFDLEYLRYLNGNHFCQIKRGNEFYRYKEVYLDKAVEFADIIYNGNNEEIDSFVKIYRKQG